jgi:rare lipoprotein A (peptidoglycan hydrolase)
MEISMRAFLAAAVAALAIAGGASLPAEAFTGTGLREGGLGDGGAQARHDGAGAARLHLVRATADDDDDEDAHPARRLRSERWYGPRHAKPRDVRSGRRAAADRRAARRAAHGTARDGVRTTRRAATAQPVAAAGGTTGMASFYWQGQRTATGERFNPAGMTAAHRSLPFGTRVRVTHLGNGRSVDVRINDRGPFIGGRIIDLSRGAAGVLGMHGQGVARVKMTVLGR